MISQELANELLSTFLEAMANQPIKPMPKPVTQEWLAIAYSNGLVRKSDLEDGAYYHGICRNARVARWNSVTQRFTYVRHKFSCKFYEDIHAPEDDDGFDLFLAMARVEPTPEQEIKEGGLH